MTIPYDSLKTILGMSDDDVERTMESMERAEERKRAFVAMLEGQVRAALVPVLGELTKPDEGPDQDEKPWGLAVECGLGHRTVEVTVRWWEDPDRWQPLGVNLSLPGPGNNLAALDGYDPASMIGLLLEVISLVRKARL